MRSRSGQDLATDSDWVLNPAAARLRDGTLQLYLRIVSPGTVSRIGSYRASERADGTLLLASCGDALVPDAPYELRDVPGGYGCEDPRVTYIPVIERYVMAYVGFGDANADMDSIESPQSRNSAQATAVDRMHERLRTPVGRTKYAKRKTTIEPVFGTIKRVIGYRQTLLRGLEKVDSDWRLVCAAFNIKKMLRAIVART